MNWRRESVPIMNRKAQLKNYVKSELMNYYFYLQKKQQLEEQIRVYEQMQNDPVAGGSVIQVANHAYNGMSAQARLFYRKADAENNLKYYENKLTALDMWMNLLTPAQHDIVKTYVMKYQCERIERAADELHYRSDTINKNTRRAIEKIIAKLEEKN